MSPSKTLTVDSGGAVLCWLSCLVSGALGDRAEDTLGRLGLPLVASIYMVYSCMRKAKVACIYMVYGCVRKAKVARIYMVYGCVRKANTAP